MKGKTMTRPDTGDGFGDSSGYGYGDGTGYGNGDG